ncbi:hypothetical protein P8C59_007562 [Phyllachora maydis]|uniref:Uncharacterized protein n=1 Tax=Phyllachora maydis TaxID=1825666 RepID=A0AAD9I905_9PEZI|nr:hypothetical protein P8C59_007562 [Phyllachora maydis]
MMKPLSSKNEARYVATSVTLTAKTREPSWSMCCLYYRGSLGPVNCGYNHMTPQKGSRTLATAQYKAVFENDSDMTRLCGVTGNSFTLNAVIQIYAPTITVYVSTKALVGSAATIRNSHFLPTRCICLR